MSAQTRLTYSAWVKAAKIEKQAWEVLQRARRVVADTRLLFYSTKDPQDWFRLMQAHITEEKIHAAWKLTLIALQEAESAHACAVATA